MENKKSAPARARSSQVQAHGNALQPQYNLAAPQAPPPPTQSSYDNIPAELQVLPQWVCWRLETVDGRQTKVPYNPVTGRKASSTYPASWGSFDAACHAFTTKGMTGIGFVLTDDDPYTGIDIDDKRESPANDAERQVHASILANVDSYTERSPGERWRDEQGNERGGYHVIIRGHVDGGRDRDHVGLYSSKRYLTFTGDVVRNAPVNDYQTFVHNLVSQMPGPQDADVPLEEVEPKCSNDEVDRRARDADNGAKYRQLYAGDWEALGKYESQSEADNALMALLTFYSDSNDQCRQMFKASGLYRPKKTTRKYMDGMLVKLRTARAKRDAEDAAFIAGIREDVAGWLARAAAKSRAEPWLMPTSQLRMKQKPVAWHIKHWLQANSLIMVHGPSGAGKTFLVIDWCMRIATGMPDWLGNRVRPGGVVYLAGEGHVGVGQRLQAWSLHNGTTEQAENMVMSRGGCDLDSPDGLAFVIKQIRECGIQPCVIVVDTLHRFMRGDENTAKDAGAMIANCDALKQEFGCSVLLVHHTGNAAEAQQRARGSSAWRGALDVEIGVQPPPAGEGARVVSLLKMRDADPVPPVCVMLQPVDLPGWVDEDGEQVASSVLVAGGELPQKGRPAADFEEKKEHWREAWLAHGTTLLHGEHLAPHLARASLVQWLQEHMNRTPRTAASYLQPRNKSGVIGLLLDKGWLQVHGDGWVCLDAADSSTMMMARNAGVGRAKVGAK